MKIRHRGVVITALALCGILVAVQAPAQQRQPQHIYTPMASPHASVHQTIGVTEMSVDYHRPAVNDRDLWGSLIPYGQMWRTGANENTVVSFSTDVSVEGQALAAGSYGLHTIPGESEWEVVFSHDTSAWGSFAYDQAQDALRVQVTSGEAPFFQERLAFTFEDVDNEKATLALHWGNLRVPIQITADTHELALASFRDQLKGLSRFFWPGWNQAANYALQNDVALEEALTWADSSIQAEERFDNLSTKAQLLVKLDRADEANEIMSRALGMGNAGQLHNYARQLLGQDRKEDALEVFQRNVEQNGDAWFVELGLARGYSALGQFEKAAEQMRIAVGRAPEPQKAYVQGLVEQLEAGKDIN